MSDPFQPVERKFKLSLKCLELLAETKYPFVVSTKSILPTEEPYYSLFKECNCVFQTSLVCPTLIEKYETASSFEERLDMVNKMSKVCKRVVVRCQPYLMELHNEIKEQIKKISDNGAYGIVYEAMKMQKKTKGLVKIGADFVYPKNILKQKFIDLKEECHKNGLVFLSGENRLRNLGDSLVCCGTEGLEGFITNKYNLNHYLFDKENFKPTSAMNKIGSATVFDSCFQSSAPKNAIRKMNFKQMMDNICKDKNYLSIFLGD